MYETIIIDTVDIAAQMCEEAILARHGIDTIGDIPYGGGYALFEKEFEKTLLAITKMGYGLVTISHAEEKTFKDKNGNDSIKHAPTLGKRARKVVLRMTDIIGFINPETDAEGRTKTYMYLRGTSHYEAGSRFSRMVPAIEFSYDNLVKAIVDAIEAMGNDDNAQLTDDRENLYKEMDHGMSQEEFDSLLEKTLAYCGEAVKINADNQVKIGAIIKNYLPVNQKLIDARIDQADAVMLIQRDVCELLGIK